MCDVPAVEPPRGCSCYPGEHPVPCPGKHALTECWRAAVLAETQEMIVELKGHDRQPHEQALLDYMMRVRTAIEGYGDGPLPRVQWRNLDKPTLWTPAPPDYPPQAVNLASLAVCALGSIGLAAAIIYFVDFYKGPPIPLWFGFWAVIMGMLFLGLLCEWVRRKTT